MSWKYQGIGRTCTPSRWPGSDRYQQLRTRQAERQPVYLWKSRIFPGLWLDEAALFACDSAKLIATVQQGIATPQHADFVRTLAERRSR